MSTTSTQLKTASIESIEFLNDSTILVVVSDEASAKLCLKRNPRCQLQRDPTDNDPRIGLIYSIEDTDLIKAIKRPR